MYPADGDVSGISNKTAVQGILEIFVKGDVSAVDRFFAANWVNHDPSLPPLKGLEGAKQLIGMWGAFSDGKVVIQDSVTECHKVAVRFVITGKHAGAFMGIAPTGKPANVLATGIFRIVDGKADDNWVNFDAPGLLQQAGAVPAPKI